MWVSEALVVHNCPENFTGEALVLSEEHLQNRLCSKRTSVTYSRLTTSVCAESFYPALITYIAEKMTK